MVWPTIRIHKQHRIGQSFVHQESCKFRCKLYGGWRIKSTILVQMWTSPLYHDPDMLSGMSTMRATEGIMLKRVKSWSAATGQDGSPTLIRCLSSTQAKITYFCTYKASPLIVKNACCVMPSVFQCATPLLLCFSLTVETEAKHMPLM